MKRIFAPALLLLLVQTTWVFVCAPNLLHGAPELTGDGLTYDHFARQICAAVRAHDFSAALRGGEDVYFFMPALRYFLAVLRLVGVGFYGYVILYCALPAIVFALLRKRWSWAIAAAFACVVCAPLPLATWPGAIFLDTVNTGFGETFAYACFLAGLTVYLSRPRATAFVWFFLAASARPNLLPAIVLLALLAWRQRTAWLGFAPIVLLPLHNFVFGHRFVLATDLAADPHSPISADVLGNLHAFFGDHAVVRGLMWSIVAHAAWVSRHDPRRRILPWLALVEVSQFLYVRAIPRYTALATFLALATAVEAIASKVPRARHPFTA